jgi:hypothetical protein
MSARVAADARWSSCATAGAQLKGKPIMTAIKARQAPQRALQRGPVGRRLAAAIVLAFVAGGVLDDQAALALEEQKGETAALEACDRRLCGILVGKNPQGPDLRCALTKTWAKSAIKEADSQHVSWGFGDARCSMDIKISRASLVEAVTDKKTTFRPGRLTANCLVEQDGRLEKVTAIVSPKIEFRDGNADKVWIRLKSIDGPTSVKLTVQTAAQLADTFGVFHRQMLKNINRYIGRHCPKAVNGEAETSAKGKGK